ncbi:hypothetical protein [Massilia phosphatilytica]
MFVARRGLKRTLFILCCAVNIPNLTFLAMSIALPSDAWTIAAGVIVEKFLRLRLGGLHDLPDAAARAGQVHDDALRLRHRA